MDSRSIKSAPPADAARELELISLDALPSGSAAIALLFTAFLLYNWFTVDAVVRVPILVSDVLMAVGAAAVWLSYRRRWLSPRALGFGGVLLLVGSAVSVMLSAALQRDAFVSVYMGLVVIVAGNVILETRLAFVTVMAIALGWAAMFVAWPEPLVFSHHLFVFAVSCAVSIVLHRARARTNQRLAELRVADRAREQALEVALSEAAVARRDLDRKVDERTAELQTELAERRRAEAESAGLGDQLRQAQKMEAVGRLAGGIAHDFNNLLTVLRASLEVASQRLTHDPAADEALRDASDAADRAAALTRGLLAFGRKQTLERAPIDAAEITRGLDRMLARIAGEKVRIVMDTNWRDSTVLVDRGQIEQVLLNLVINACDAMPHGGTLRLAVLDGALTAEEARARSVAAGAYVRVLVSDTGTGMDERTKAALFEPFFTTKPVGQGTGLGLAVAHGIVTQHGGVIEVASAPGAGSTFEVWLPRVAQPARSTAAPVSSIPPRLSQAKETILVVEDEPGVRRATVRILESYGYHVLVAQDGATALSLAAARESIDLVVSDVVMPDLDGPAVVALLRKRWPELKALFVSGYTAEHFAEGSAVRNDTLLQKPFRPKELANAVREAMHGAA